MNHKYGETRCFNNGEYKNTVRKDGSVYIETEMLNKSVKIKDSKIIMAEKSIIEKLGISPLRIDSFGDIVSKEGSTVFEECLYGSEETQEANKKLIATAPEMLEALIEITDRVTHVNERGEIMKADISDIDYLNLLNIIEKSTGKSWEEIKELL